MSSAEDNIKARLDAAREVLRTEAASMETTARLLDSSFLDLVDLFDETDGLALVSGVGKSGIVARKVAGTLNSIGRRAVYLNPLDALHGDLGIASTGDVALFFSKSGSSGELEEVARVLGARSIPICLVSASATGMLQDLSTVNVMIGLDREACPLDLVPTASTASMIGIGDALSVALMRRRAVTPADFAASHPSGRLGRVLNDRVTDFMTPVDRLPIVAPETPLVETVVIMSNGRLGCALVLDGARSLVGIVTDGDLRRAIGRDSITSLTASDVMSPDPMTAKSSTMAINGLRQLEQSRRTHLPIVDIDCQLVGLCHIHDFVEAGL